MTETPLSEWTTHPWVAEADRRIRFGIVHPLLGVNLDWPPLERRVRVAEEFGFDSYWFSDHPLLNPDCWIRLAGLAATTRTIRLGTLVTCIYYRHPALLARMAADVDRMSQGRLLLGLGAGDFEPEFAQMGIDFPPIQIRQQALAEGIHILRGMWGASPFTFRGAHFSVQDAHISPGPWQQPRVPMLIAGAGERVTLRQVAEFADASNFGPNPHTGNVLTLEQAQVKFATLERHCNQVGRPPRSVLRTYWSPPVVLADSSSALQAKVAAISEPEHRFYGERMFIGTPDEAIAHFQALIDAGLQYFIVHTRADSDTERLIAENVMPFLTTAS